MKRLVSLLLFALLLAGTGLSFSIVIDKATYSPGDSVVFNITDTPNNQVNVSFWYPNQTIMASQNYTMDGSGQSLSNSQVLGTLAINGMWNISAYNGTDYLSPNFDVLVKYVIPTVSLNSSSVSIIRNTAKSILISVTNNVNTNDTLLLNFTGCDGTNFTCDLSAASAQFTAGETKTFVLNVNATATATTGAYSMPINVNHSLNPSNNASASLSIIIGSGSTVNLAIGSSLVYYKSAENLTLNISSVIKESTGSEITPTTLNFTLRNSAGTVLNSTSPATKNALYSFGTSGWLPGNYTIVIYANDSDGNYGSSTISFAIFRATQLSASASPTSVAQNSSTTLTITSKSNAGSPLAWSFAVPSGLTCTPSSGSGTTSVCNVSSSATAGSYVITISQSGSSCLVSNTSAATCTMTPAISNSTNVTMTVTVAGPQNNQTQQNDTPDTDQPAPEQPNMVGPLRITLPAAVEPTATSFSITIENTDPAITKSVVLSVDETGDYVHFVLSHGDVSPIATGGSSQVSVSLTPLPYMKPGRYVFTVTINSKPFETSMTIPAPTDNKSIYRYLDVKKDRTSSLVTIYVKNPANVTSLEVIENISKDVATNVSEITFVSNISYRVISDDPVIAWMINFTDSNEAVIQYSVNKDLASANFSEPGLNLGAPGEEKKSQQLGEIFSDPLAMAIIALILISAGGGVIYFHSMKAKKEGTAHEKALKKLGPQTSGKAPNIFSLELQRLAFKLSCLADRIKSIKFRRGGGSQVQKKKEEKETRKTKEEIKEPEEKSPDVDELKRQMADLQKKMELLEKKKK